MNLFEFIGSRISSPKVWPRNMYVEHPDWESLYVRCTKRYLGNKVHDPVIDLANITAKNPGNGAFRSLFAELRKAYPQAAIFVESVLSERFRDGLLRMGFTKVPHESNFYLLPSK